MNNLLQVVLENNPELLIHAAKIDNNMIFDETGKTIVVQVDNDKIPVGFKKAKENEGNRYNFYKEVRVIATNIFKMSKPYLTEYGWKDATDAAPTELVPITLL